jgi:hypothetical protein
MIKTIGKGEYSEVICRYLQHSFPKAAKVSQSNVLEILTDLMVGNKEMRYGPKPKIESLYTIRQTLQKAIELSAPIPILVPWGGRKADSSLSIDIAEVSALKQLISLDEMIKHFHPAGLHIHIAIEDLGASWLYRVQNNVDQSIDRYSSDFGKLVNMLKGDTSLEPIRESKLMDKEIYFATSERYSELIEAVIQVMRAYKDIDVNTIPEFETLKKAGWKGDLSAVQQDYYLERYRSLYPGRKEAEYVLMLSDYLGGSKARYDLDGRGEPDSAVGSYIKLSFVPQIPGAPTSMFSNTLYYRTIPESAGRTHVAPWRGKGYLEIVDDIPVPKVTHFGNSILNDLEESSVTLVDGEDNLILRSDYRITINPMILPGGMIM